MRLRKDQIQKISEKVLAHLQKKRLIVAKAEPSALLQKIEQVITANLQAEDRLEEETKKLMEQFRRQISSSMNEHELFQKIKKQLAKDKKFVL